MRLYISSVGLMVSLPLVTQGAGPLIAPDAKKLGACELFVVWIKNAGLSSAKKIHIDVDDNLPLSHLYELKDTTLSETNFIKKRHPIFGAREF